MRSTVTPKAPGLDHVVDGERGDRAGGHRLHLDPRATDRPHLGGQHDQPVVGLDPRIDTDECERQRVGERTQLSGALGRLDSGQPRGSTTSPLRESPAPPPAVSGDIRTTASARAYRSVGCFAPMSTILAAPSSSRWGSSAHGAAPRPETRVGGAAPSTQRPVSPSAVASISRFQIGASALILSIASGRPRTPLRGGRPRPRGSRWTAPAERVRLGGSAAAAASPALDALSEEDLDLALRHLRVRLVVEPGHLVVPWR